MHFLENKYKKWYDNIINSAKNRNINGYVENHHILPKSLGGDDIVDNLVRLTAREHFICHLLLTKFTTGYNKKLMNFALGKFIQNSPLQQRIFNSWEYNKIRESISNARTGHKHSDDTKKKMSESMKGVRGHQRRIEQCPHCVNTNVSHQHIKFCKLKQEN